MAILLRHKNSIYGLNDDLNGIETDINDETAARIALFGNLPSLQTTEKATLVGAINELVTEAGDAGADTLKKADNLSDLTDVAAARTNLEVMEKNAFDVAMQVAKIALGTNHTVADITERDALTQLTVDDRVTVLDSGDGTWAAYKPLAIDGGSGLVTDWTLIHSETALNNVIDPATLRTTYASNADTNIFRDADQVKVDHLSATAAIDLHDVVLATELVTDMAGLTFGDHATDGASVDAAKAYIEGVASVGGLVPNHESVVVVGDQVTLEFPPVNGVAGICNFASARYVDENDVSFDATLQSTGNNKVFNLLLPTTGLWDGKTIQVQYFHFLDMSNYEEIDSGGDEGTTLEGTSGIESTATDDDFDGWIDQGILPNP
jgi:hypothetical protein